jgi:4-hydroxy-2-oxoheptanedioate aldolase
MRTWVGYALQLAIDRRDDMTGPLPLPLPEPDQPGPVLPGPRSAGSEATIRQSVRGGERLLGTFSVIPSTDVIELIALAGFDFVILDMEHGPYTVQLVHTCLLAAAAHRLAAIVRVPEHNPALIGSVLDVGAHGVLVPQVRSADEAAAVVDAARFAPRGSRGSNPWVRAARYAGSPEWLARSNEETLVMVMVEGTEAVRQIDRIIGVDGLDAIFLGPVDMSHALGVPGQPEHPRVLSTLVEVAGKARAADVTAAVFAPDAARARAWWSAGLTMVACAVDSRMILDGLRSTVHEALS